MELYLFNHSVYTWNYLIRLRGASAGALCLGEKCRVTPHPHPEGTKCRVRCPRLLTFLPAVEEPLDVDMATEYLLIPENLRPVRCGFTSSRRS